MQESEYFEGEVRKNLKEFFGGDCVEEQMDRRLASLPGHTLVRRIHIGRNDPCPCDSGKKFKKCCINKVQKYEG